jgi:hypothetical protein
MCNAYRNWEEIQRMKVEMKNPTNQESLPLDVSQMMERMWRHLFSYCEHHSEWTPEKILKSSLSKNE